MDRDRKKALLDRSLERAAEALGDITGPVYDLYYARHPEAREDFAYHDPGGRAQLEGTMVEQALYCLMEWFDSPGEIEIILLTTIPHHIETLGVSIEQFTRLLAAVCEVLNGTIPPGEIEERAVLAELEKSLLDICAQAAACAGPHRARRTA